MSAEAAARTTAPFEADGGRADGGRADGGRADGGRADGGRGRAAARRAANEGHAGRASARPASRHLPKPQAERDPSWNVLAAELVSFPRPGRHASLDRPTALSSQPGSGHAGSRSYGEAWLERELLTIRYLADSGYPAASGRRSSPSATAGFRDDYATDGSSALALPLPQGDELAPVHVPGPRQRRQARESDVSESRRRPGAADVEARPLRHAAAVKPRGLRRLLPGVATLAALAGIWAGAGVLSSAQTHPLAVLPGSVKTPGGYMYVVRPGDTLWSIATRLDPSGDPRPLVAELARQVHGGELLPGSRLDLP
jgi:hypothetical protein